MKKVFTLFTISFLCCASTTAQEAFKHLGMSVEFGTTGLGVNISYPVITDKLIVSVGYNFPTFTIKTSSELNSQIMNDRINAANEIISSYNNMVTAYNKDIQGYPKLQELSTIDRVENVETVHADINAKLNFGNFKTMVEYYPTTKSFFHITAGFMVGNGEWINVTADANQKVWNTYINAIKQNAAIPTLKRGELTEKATQLYPNIAMEYYPYANMQPVSGLESAVKVNINKDTYLVSPETNGHIESKLKIQSFKPYLGIGFGTSVPTAKKKRLGFQMEIGAYYQGKPTFESKNIVEYDPNAYSSKTIDEIVDMVQYLRWYPQLSFRFTGRIF